MTYELLLDELLEAAHEQARRILIGKADGQLVPVWFLINDEGEEKIIATPFGSHDDKDLVVAYMRQFMAANNVVAYSYLSEGWAVMTPKGVDPQSVGEPTKHPERREMVLALACDRHQTKSRYWNIKRDKRGRVTALPEEVETRNGMSFGIFEGLLGRAN